MAWLDAFKDIFDVMAAIASIYCAYVAYLGLHSASTTTTSPPKPGTSSGIKPGTRAGQTRIGYKAVGIALLLLFLARILQIEPIKGASEVLYLVTIFVASALAFKIGSYLFARLARRLAVVAPNVSDGEASNRWFSLLFTV